jgi:microcystin-dependent protein
MALTRILNRMLQASTTAFNFPEWAGSRAYVVGDSIKRGNTMYMCLSAHTSNSTFSIDWLTNGYWVALGDHPGIIKSSGNAVAPAGFKLCDGASYLRTDFPDLFAYIGTTFGYVDSTHFNVPDSRGMILKGSGTTNRTAASMATNNQTGAAGYVTNTAATDVYYTATLGTYTQDKVQGHTHLLQINNVGATNVLGLSGVAQAPYNTPVVGAATGGSMSIATPYTDGINGTIRTGLTTEPQSLGVCYLIKW